MLPLSDSDLKTRSRPIVNLTLIGICAVVLFYELAIGASDREIFFYKFGLIPAELTHGFNYQLLRAPNGIFDISTPIPNWMTLFTSIFIHGDWLHFAGNMLFLWIFGNYVEVRFGHLRYLLFFLAAGVAGAWLQIATDTASQVPIIGASGAIAGVLAIYLFFLPYSRLGMAVIFIGFWFFLQFAGAAGSLGPSAQGESVAYWAHIGGFILGIAVGIVYKLATRRKPWSGETDVPRYWRGRRL
jgi:membrane associated rhomboid family serine protease